jgi:CRISP-associated protein Cas1
VVEKNESLIRTSRKQLLIHQQDEVYSFPIEDLFAVVIDTPGASITSAALRELSSQGTSLIITDEKHLPVGQLTPMVGHSLLQKRLQLQLATSLPLKKRLWRDIVIQKIKGQARTLNILLGSDNNVEQLCRKVGSGDPKNIEAVAAKRYWPRLFEDPRFRRMRANEDQNRLLNFGYSIIRSALTRNIVASGLHPALGIHHSNQYNPFCLADDIIEPFRPLVDLKVAEWIKDKDNGCELTREARQNFISIMHQEISVDGVCVSCLRATELAVQHFVGFLEKTRKNWCEFSW